MTISFDKPMKPAEFAEKQLLSAILDGVFKPGDTLPGERALARDLGVTRPTLREILQRLAREGWVTIAHGKPTRINDYLSQGGLGVLTSLARHGRHLSGEVVAGLLEVRTALMPGAAQKAAESVPGAILDLLAQTPETDAPAMARYDWDLQMLLVQSAGNPILKMIFNDFTPLYQVLGEAYFKQPKAIEASLLFYKELAAATRAGDTKAVYDVVRSAMEQAQTLWQEMACSEPN